MTNHRYAHTSLKAHSFKALGVAVAVSAVISGVAAQDKSADAERVPSFIQRGQPGHEHRQLDPLVGSWKVEGKWMVAGGTPEKPIQGENLRTTRQWVAGGRFLHDVTEGSVGGSPYWRTGYLGYSNVDRRYEWITLDATNSMFMVYQGKPGSKVLNMSGKFTDQGLLGEKTVGKRVGQRTEIVIESPARHIIRLFMTPPGGREFLASEMIYTRASKGADAAAQR
ncbi:DUF1579 family protein [Bradyrhizobium australiense]|uniref:DUF1579 domain-containing protein n=1 Tax=Bradyrhizobium australiense TaxID=2721161 RepID=A0A7Y4LTU3_9BRAD|nr:DUF1579 family protein [Bradyrhizobium australiense]NOJ38055.1 DUF1579 domain-containing protein [Bradyrhizobium australiense]